MKKPASCIHILILILFTSAGSQIWLVKNVSNIFPDDCYVSFGDNTGIAYCFPERYIEREKIADWDDDALCYILYPVYPVATEDEEKVEKKKKKKRRKSRRKKRDKTEEDSTEAISIPEPPKRKFDEKDSLYLLERGEILYQFKDILIYKTYTPLHEEDVDSYSPFQLFKPEPPAEPVNENQ
jgi:hypothetical protein